MRRVPLLILAGVAACGEPPPPHPVGEPPVQGTRISREETEALEREARLQAERMAAFDAAVEEARGMAARGDLEGARAALERARGIGVQRVGVLEKETAAVDEKEAAAKRTADRAEVLRLLADARPGDTPEARAAVLKAAAARAREHLARWPGGDPEGEVEAGAVHAEAEVKRCRAYAGAFARARKALDAKDWAAALGAADEALRVFPREEARTVRLEALRGSTPAGMVLVPGGPALLGRRKETVAVPPFFIDRTEVTNAKYAEFLLATGRAPPAGWVGYSPPAGKLDHPVVNVSGEEAGAYAKWAGKRLPTEVEWEKAARGADGRLYPWGDAFDPRNGNFGADGTRAAGGNPGDLSPFGVLDAGGNVSEFTVSVYGFRKPEGPVGDEDLPRWVVKGGHWGSEGEPENAVLFLRFPFRAGEKDKGTGFRCAKDAP